MLETPKLQPAELEELGAEAKNMLATGSAFNRVATYLTGVYMAELMSVPVGDLTVGRTHAKLHALNDLKQGLKRLVAEADGNR